MTRYVNTIEGDFQINNAIAGHIGYRYTHRKVDVIAYDANADICSVSD
ncbi:MAG: hypothetical protein IPG67_11000 [Acidobacteria bacterium]|nr:hypothetical protein [Acidobacteriota bacterium]